MTHRWIPFFAGAALALSACTPGAPTLPDGVVADFALVDRNPNSPTHEEVISPRDHLEKVSGWYFMHAT